MFIVPRWRGKQFNQKKISNRGGQKMNRIVAIPIFIGMLQIMLKRINAAQECDATEDEKNY
jgi:hypothetical protein